jgi:hypothetical protein
MRKKHTETEKNEIQKKTTAMRTINCLFFFVEVFLYQPQKGQQKKQFDD